MGSFASSATGLASIRAVRMAMCFPVDIFFAPQFMSSRGWHIVVSDRTGAVGTLPVKQIMVNVPPGALDRFPMKDNLNITV